MVLCPRVDHKAAEDFAEALINYGELLGMYTNCRLRHGALVEFERRKK